MKPSKIKFFTPRDNSVESPKPQKKAPRKVKGYISPIGGLVFPALTLRELGIEAETTQFRVGTDAGQRKMTTLYLIPSEEQGETFSFERYGRGYTLFLATILSKGGVDFVDKRTPFTTSLFKYDEGVIGYQVEIENSASPIIAEDEKRPYTGKRRGRKPKAQAKNGGDAELVQRS